MARLFWTKDFIKYRQALRKYPMHYNALEKLYQAIKKKHNIYDIGTGLERLKETEKLMPLLK